MLAQIDKSWQSFFNQHQSELTEILNTIASDRLAPARENIFRVFSYPIDHYRAVIVGQDPYPTPGYATGLAFSVSPEATKLPASLKNIFTEYVSDTGFSRPKNGDLSLWASSGVALLNSSLTINLDDKSDHLKIGWQRFTSAALSVLANHGCVAILLGSQAQKLGTAFAPDRRIESVHPSPLSAYRGFFGSRPFTRCNELLIASKQDPINWRLP